MRVCLFYFTLLVLWSGFLNITFSGIMYVKWSIAADRISPTLDGSTVIVHLHSMLSLYCDLEMPNSPFGPFSSTGDPRQAGMSTCGADKRV